MSNKQRIAWYGAFLALGIAAVVLSALGHIDDVIGACGITLAIISSLGLFKAARYAKNPAFAKKVDVSNSDERLAYISSRAAQSTFQISVVGLCVLSLALRFVGGKDTADVLGFVAAVEITIYWVSYIIAGRKY